MNPYPSLKHLYWESTSPTRALTLLMYPAAAFGLARAYYLSDPSTAWMFQLFGIPGYCNALGWGLVISYIFCARYLGLFCMRGFKWTLRTTPAMGFAFWAALLTSNVVDTDHLAFGLLYGVAALLELWIFVRNWQETQ